MGKIIDIKDKPKRYYEIKEMLCLSTAHITKETCEKLTDKPWPVVAENEYGFFIYVPEVDEPKEEISGIREVMALARRLGVKYVQLDCDGPVENELPIYDW